MKGMTFSEVVARADAMSVPTVEVSSGQQVAFEIPKPFDYRLKPGERNAVNYRLRELNEAVSVYRVESLPADEATRRQILEFAKGLVGNPTVVVPSDTAAAAKDLDKLATEIQVNVAIESKTDPKALVTALAGTSKHLGIAGDIAGWMQNGVAPVDGLKAAGAKLMVLEVSDRSAHRRQRHECAARQRRRGTGRGFSGGVSRWPEAVDPHRGVRGHHRRRHAEESRRVRARDAAGHGRARAHDAGLARRPDPRRRQADGGHAREDRSGHAAQGARDAQEAAASCW